jgi:hypothetical protein
MPTKEAEKGKLNSLPAKPGEAQEGRILEVLREAKKLAQEYRTLIGKLLGITGEVAEYEAARLLKVKRGQHGRPGTMQLSRLQERTLRDKVPQ